MQTVLQFLDAVKTTIGSVFTGYLGNLRIIGEFCETTWGIDREWIYIVSTAAVFFIYPIVFRVFVAIPRAWESFRISRDRKTIAKQAARQTGGRRLKYVAEYRPLPLRFQFEYVSNAGKWKAYIDGDIDYRGRDTSFHATHRLGDGNRKYICWDRPVTSLNDMIEISKMWADATAKYIDTGTRF